MDKNERVIPSTTIRVICNALLGLLQLFCHRITKTNNPIFQNILGIAFRGLKKHKLLYPMICSTASQSAVKLIYTMSFPATLMYDCMKTLNISDIDKLKNVPGLKKINERGFWILELALSN